MSAEAVGIRCDTSAVIALRVPAELNEIMKLLPIEPSTDTFPMLVIAESELSADFTLDPVISTTLNGVEMLPVASRKYRLIGPLSPFTKRGGADGVKFVKLVASLRFVMSM